MDTQDFLTLLFDAIALLFIVIVTFDFITFISISTLHQKPPVVNPVKDENEQQPNVIDMAHSKSTFSPVPETTAPVNNLLQGIDIEKLQLRPARKIAKALNIAQKVHGKDAPVSWLRSQIKARLKDQPVQTAEVISSILQQAS